MFTSKNTLVIALTTLCLTHGMQTLWADQAASDEMCETEVRPYRVGARHIESKGVGYNQGYTTVEGFFSTPKSLDSCLVPFIDLRGHVFNNGKFAANAGLGLRLVSSRVWGINSYYDYRKTERFHYNQVSVGLESLGRLWDFRVNGYLPVGKKESSLYHTKFHEFEGNRMILRSKREFAMKGLNAEAAAHFDMPKGMTCYVAAGPYYFEGEGKNAIGGEARVRVMLHKYVGAQVSGSYDPVFKGIIQGEVRLTYPFGPKNHTVKKVGRSCPDTQILRTVAMQPVDRNEIIVTDRKHKLTTAINPDTNEPFFFIFVDNTSSSDGTFESPYPTLAAARDASNPGDVIFVFPGDGTDTGMDESMILKDDQRFLGSSIPHTFVTTLGTVNTPQFTANAPVISNAMVLTDVVILANDNEVSGFTINQLQSGENGITGSGITNVAINNNRITSMDDGNVISLFSSPHLGTVTISNNLILSSDTSDVFGIVLTGSANADMTINNNAFSGINSSSGLSQAFVLNDLENSTLALTSNAFSSETNGNTAYAINIEHTIANSSLQATISNNTIDMPSDMVGTAAGIRAISTETGPFSLDITNNVVNMPPAGFLKAGIQVITGVTSGPLCVNVIGNSITIPAGAPGDADGFIFTHFNGAQDGCVVLSGNTAITPPANFGYNLVNSGGTLNAFIGSNNSGTFDQTGTITPVTSCSGICTN